MNYECHLLFGDEIGEFWVRDCKMSSSIMMVDSVLAHRLDRIDLCRR
jgi:hypothetical protein